MTTPNADRLSQVETLWTVLCHAHAGSDSAQNAREKLLARYGQVVHRYLLGALRDTHAADELSQEFCLRFLRGDLKGADRTRGRFRDFVKGVLFHLIGDHRRRRKKDHQALPAQHDPPANDEGWSNSRFRDAWRGELLDRAWQALSAHEANTGQLYHTVLCARTEDTELRSERLAEVLSSRLGKPVTAVWVRQTLHRARKKFAEILLDLVAQTLVSPTRHDVQQELIDVDLYEYCRPLLEKPEG